MLACEKGRLFRFFVWNGNCDAGTAMIQAVHSCPNASQTQLPARLQVLKASRASSHGSGVWWHIGNNLWFWVSVSTAMQEVQALSRKTVMPGALHLKVGSYCGCGSR